MSLSEILSQCLSKSDTIRKAAEKKVDEMGTENFPGLMQECSVLLADEGMPKESRQLCATLIKNMICYNGRYKGKWEQMDPSQKQIIKNYILSCLASKNKEIRKAAGMTVAGICQVEIPRGEWPDIIGILINTSSNEDINIRMSSIITIGYLSQEISPEHISSGDIDLLLSGLINNMKTNEDLEIAKHATIAFLNFLHFAQKNMSVDTERSLILNTIINLLSHPVVDLQVYAMQCLVEVSRLYYDFLGSNMDQLYEVTANHMLRSDEKVSIQAYEFWCSISDEEVRRASNKIASRMYCDKFLDGLFGVISTHLLNRNSEKEKIDPDAWNNVKAASCLLTNLSQCTHEKLIDYIFDMISNYFTSQEAKLRDSTILAFGSVLETIHIDKVRQIIPGALDSLINMLKDQNSEVRATTAWAIKKITEYHSEVFQNNPNLFDTFINKIQENIMNSNRKVSVQLLDALNFLVMRSGPSNEQIISTGLISKHIPNLLPLLLSTAYSKEAFDAEDNITLAAFYAMGSIIDFAPMDMWGYIQEFFGQIYGAFEASLNIINFTSVDVRNAYQGYIATVISACTAAEKVKMNVQEATMVYNMIEASFEQRECVYEEGLMACSSIALTIGPSFVSLLPNFGKYLTWALKQWQEFELCRIAINSTSDLVRSCGPEMEDYLKQITPLILDILEVKKIKKYFLLKYTFISFLF
jgi:importin subunit beta-1